MNKQVMWEYLSAVGFAYPWFLLLLLLIPIWAYLKGREGATGGVGYSSTAILKEVSRATKCNYGRWLSALRYLALALLILAIARPRHEQGVVDEKAEGIDVMMVLDFSNSMRTKDFLLDGQKTERLRGLGKVVNEFIDARKNDRVGIIGFCKDAYLVSPLTLDREWIKECLNDRIDHMRTDGGTAIGEGMAAANRCLKSSEGKSKIQIIVSDGINNAGVSPMEALEAAKKAHIKIYTVRILSFSKIETRRIENDPMNKLAKEGGGQYFQAADANSLRAVYNQIDQLEKTKFKQKKFSFYDELFKWFAIPALGLLVVEMSLGYTLWLKTQ
jgi:Ca-activated chloride channel homolog